jgi:hypothetical protein
MKKWIMASRVIIALCMSMSLQGAQEAEGKVDSEKKEDEITIKIIGNGLEQSWTYKPDWESLLSDQNVALLRDCSPAAVSRAQAHLFLMQDERDRDLRDYIDREHQTPARRAYLEQMYMTALLQKMSREEKTKISFAQTRVDQGKARLKQLTKLHIGFGIFGGAALILFNVLRCTGVYS